MVDKRDKAVVMCADRAYLPFALHLGWQIDRLCPGRDFDIVFASSEELALPASLSPFGFKVIKVPTDDRYDRLPVNQIPRSTYLRLYLPGSIKDQYRRLLYLDGDIDFDGGDLSRLMDLPLGQAAIGAVRAARQIINRRSQPEEYGIARLAEGPYYNAGVLLIDTAAYVEKRCLDRMHDAAATWPKALVLADQSMLNLALRDEIAELNPVWNWGLNLEFRLLGQDLPIRFRHFIGPSKPWNDPRGRLSARWRDRYERFFATYLPEALARLGPRPRAAVARPGKFLHLVGHHLRYGRAAAAFMGRFRDEWDVKQ